MLLQLIFYNTEYNFEGDSKFENVLRNEYLFFLIGQANKSSD